MAKNGGRDYFNKNDLRRNPPIVEIFIAYNDYKK